MKKVFVDCIVRAQVALTNQEYNVLFDKDETSYEAYAELRDKIEQKVAEGKTTLAQAAMLMVDA